MNERRLQDEQAARFARDQRAERMREMAPLDPLPVANLERPGSEEAHQLRMRLHEAAMIIDRCADEFTRFARDLDLSDDARRQLTGLVIPLRGDAERIRRDLAA